jgi:C_GCAxxG_C_C family probable redox protein
MSNRVVRRSRELWDAEYYCAESVLTAISEALDIQSELIPRIATGFCSGLARTCGLCGAVAGGMLALSACLGRDLPTDSEEELYEAIRQLQAGFQKKFGSINCFELTGCDLGTDEGQDKFHTSGQKDKCREYVETAARLAWELIPVAYRPEP